MRRFATGFFSIVIVFVLSASAWATNGAGEEEWVEESVPAEKVESVPRAGGADADLEVKEDKPPPETGVAMTGEEDQAEEEKSLDYFTALYQPYIRNISAYEPIYFLVGVDPDESRFQFSFKYRFINSDGPLAKEHPWVKGIHFGYTQTSFWELNSDSQPFEDTSYKPELFHLSGNIETRPYWMQGLFLKTGVLHESNGRADEMSRGTNIVYFMPIAILYDDLSRMGMSISPKFWIDFNNSDNNPDIEEYRGYFDLSFKFGKADSFVFDAMCRWAEKGNSLKFDATYPVGHKIFENVKIYFYAQYVYMLAEGLLNYQDRTEALRLGLAFVR